MEEEKARHQNLLRDAEVQVVNMDERWGQQSEQMESPRYEQDISQRRLLDIFEFRETDLRDELTFVEEIIRASLIWGKNAEHKMTIVNAQLRQRLIDIQKVQNQENQEHLRDSEVQSRSVVDLREEKDRLNMDKTMLTEEMGVMNAVTEDVTSA